MKDDTRCKLGDGVEQSGDTILFAVIVNLEIPCLLLMDSLRGEHLIGDIEFFEGVKLNRCLGISVGLLT